MKNNRGITLTSVMIYVIGMLIVLATMANLTSFFYKNINIEQVNEDTLTQYTKFTSVFAEEINDEENYVIDCKTTTDGDKKISYIVFASGNQYTYTNEDNCIYKNKVKICQNMIDCDFSCKYIDSKYEIKVNFKTKSIDKTGDNVLVYNL